MIHFLFSTFIVTGITFLVLTILISFSLDSVYFAHISEISFAIFISFLSQFLLHCFRMLDFCCFSIYLLLILPPRKTIDTAMSLRLLYRPCLFISLAHASGFMTACWRNTDTLASRQTSYMLLQRLFDIHLFELAGILFLYWLHLLLVYSFFSIYIWDFCRWTLYFYIYTPQASLFH